MQFSNDKRLRKLQRKILKAKYPDYDARKHDAFVIKYNQELEARALKAFHEYRGIR